jgi:fluoride exporter
MNMLSLMYVAVGGAVGSMSRYALMMAVSRLSLTAFPLGTLLVNVLGGFLMGVWIAVMAGMISPGKAKDLHLLLATGVLGGFTTFSAFSVDVFLLFERGLMLQAALYIVGSVLLSVLALLLGMWCIKFIA